MSKTIVTIIILIVVVGLGYWFYQSTITPEELTEKEQACLDSGGQVSTSMCCEATDDFPNLCLIGPCGCSPENSHQVKICDCGPDKCFDGSRCVSSDEILKLLEDLEQETGIDFSEVQPVEIKWNVKRYEEIEEVVIEGKGFEATRISSEQYDSVESFLIDRGFEKDLYNIADGLFTGLVGYKKDQIVCTVSGGSTPQEPDIKDVEVKCGKGDSSIEHLFSKEELIKKLFAEKYKTKVSAITLSIDKETENHVRATIQVLDELAEGGTGDKGIFLVAKVNGSWELVEEKEKYNFPEDMTIETKNGDNFFVILDSNPTTGFQWELDFDSTYIQLIDRKYTLGSPDIIGAGGDETFNFLALESGETEITFSYLRTWEEKEPIERKVYKIIIK